MGKAQKSKLMKRNPTKALLNEEPAVAAFPSEEKLEDVSKLNLKVGTGGDPYRPKLRIGGSGGDSFGHGKGGSRK